MKLISEAVIANETYDDETIAVFEAKAIDDEGEECTAIWQTPDWSKANGDDYSECCNWDEPDAIKY